MNTNHLSGMNGFERTICISHTVVALNEWEYSDRILKRSVFRRLEKNSVYSELIEAWIKNGVLTEQELNEQMNKRK